MEIILKDLSKSYDRLPVLDHLDLRLESGNTYCLMAPSGAGKTTLLRLLMGLEPADSGQILGLQGRRITAVFQENRLCETFSPVDNLRMVMDGRTPRASLEKELRRLLPEESLRRPVSTLSGGMKRRVAICRALLPPSDIILMDEPFTGLDDATKRNVISYIKEKAKGKLLLITTHQEEDIPLLGGRLLKLIARP